MANGGAHGRPPLPAGFLGYHSAAQARQHWAATWQVADGRLFASAWPPTSALASLHRGLTPDAATVSGRVFCRSLRSILGGTQRIPAHA